MYSSYCYFHEKKLQSNYLNKLKMNFVFLICKNKKHK